MVAGIEFIRKRGSEAVGLQLSGRADFVQPGDRVTVS